MQPIARVDPLRRDHITGIKYIPNCERPRSLFEGKVAHSSFDSHHTLIVVFINDSQETPYGSECNSK